MEDTYEMQPVKHSPQDAGSVITYQRRYAIGAILCLNIDEDDDANKGSKDAKQNTPTKKTKLVLNSENYNACRNAYLQNNAVLEKIEAKYEISKDVLQELTK